MKAARLVLPSALAVSLFAASAHADSPSPYSLPFQLRPAAAGTGVRADTAFAKYEDAAANGGLTIASTLAASFKIPGTGEGPAGLAPVIKLAMVNDSPPAGNGGLLLVNPLVGASYTAVLGGGFRATGFAGVTIPVGMGGGDTPEKQMPGVRAKGQFARSQFDNALFAVNDFTAIPGVDLAYVAGGLTLQLEATMFFLERVRGSQQQLEASKINFTSGVHAGYFVVDALSIGAELRYQRWINAPIAVDKDTTNTLVDNLNFAVGPRGHFKLGRSAWIRPGLAYARGLDKPMAAATPNYHVLFVDVPIAF